MAEHSKGYLFAITAFLFWGGISPIYFKEVGSVDSFEVLLYRIIFSFFTLLPFLLFKKEFKSFMVTIKDFTKIKYLFFSTMFASINWLIFIWAVANERIIEASLGYYINPLVNVLLGFLFLKERLTRNQNIAIFIAVLAVVYQLITLGTIPFISLALAFTFGFYGLVRKKVNLGSIVGLFIEILILMPFALIYIWYAYDFSNLAITQDDHYIAWMLTLTGLVTVIPLLLFNGAATRMKLATLGFFQYIGPTMAFSVAIFIYDEPFNSNKMVTFVLIWIALLIFSLDSIVKSYRHKKGLSKA